MKKQLGEIIGIFIFWRIFLLFVGYFGIGRFPVTQNFYGKETAVDFLKAWANWDGGHYIGIAQNGYNYYFQYAFFPLYPYLIKIFSLVTLGDFFLAAQLVSTILALGSLIVFYKFTSLKFSQETAFRSIFYLLIFPTAFFLVTAYTESTFLFFSISGYYLAFKKDWKWACFFGFLTVITRPVGIVLVLALGIEYLSQVNFSFRRIRWDALWFLITPVGLIWYMWELFSIYKDPLFFIKTQSYWHRSNSFVNPWEVFVKNSNVLIQNFSNDYHQMVVLFPDYFLTVLFFIAGIIIFKTISKSLGFYTLLMTVLPLTSGTFAAQSRYVLVIFPTFILLAKWGENRLVNLAITMFSLMFLSIFTILFINGNWLA